MKHINIIRILLMASCILPLNSLAFNFYNLNLGDSCSRINDIDSENRVSHLSSHEFPYIEPLGEDQYLESTKIRHIYFIEYKDLDATLRIDCFKNEIIRLDMNTYFENAIDAAPYFNNLIADLNNKYNNVLDECNKPLQYLELESGLNPEEDECLVIWKQGNNQIDLILFKYAGHWRMMIRKRAFPAGGESTIMKGISFAPGHDG